MNSDIFRCVVSSLIPCKPPNLAEADFDLIVLTATRAARAGVRVSAHVRRGAAPYGNGCEQISGHSHLISLLILGDAKCIKAAFYVTF